MSMQKVSVLVPPARRALWTDPVVQSAIALMARLRGARAAPSAAARERRAADRAARKHARDRAELLALARRYEASQPGFAKELYAAALRDRTP